jgi:hypothetical protein
LGTPLVPREISFRAHIPSIGIDNEIASPSAFPSKTWERGKVCALFYFALALMGQRPAATTSFVRLNRHGRATFPQIIALYSKASYSIQPFL